MKQVIFQGTYYKIPKQCFWIALDEVTGDVYAYDHKPTVDPIRRGYVNHGFRQHVGNITCAEVD